MNLLLLASLIGGLSLFLIIFGLSQFRGNSVMRNRLEMYLTGESNEPVSLKEVELSRPFSDRVIMPLIRQAARFFGWILPHNRLNDIRDKLTQAGNPGRLTAIDFVGIKALVGISVTSLAIVTVILSRQPVTYTIVLLLVLMAVSSFHIPDFWLTQRITKRKQEIANALPDALDMLTITVEAGLSFESGLQEIINKWSNELVREFARVLRDIGMGQSRRQALQGLSERTGVPTVASFVAALNQAEELGVGIGRILKVQADEMRIRRRQMAQERANQAPIKMMIPLVFLVFPSIFAVLLGPAIPQLIETFGEGGIGS